MRLPTTPDFAGHHLIPKEIEPISSFLAFFVPSTLHPPQFQICRKSALIGLASVKYSSLVQWTATERQSQGTTLHKMELMVGLMWGLGSAWFYYHESPDGAIKWGVVFIISWLIPKDVHYKGWTIYHHHIKRKQLFSDSKLMRLHLTALEKDIWDLPPSKYKQQQKPLSDTQQYVKICFEKSLPLQTSPSICLMPPTAHFVTKPGLAIAHALLHLLDLFFTQVLPICSILQPFPPW